MRWQGREKSQNVEDRRGRSGGGARTAGGLGICLLYTSPSPRDGLLSRMPSSA